MPNQVGQFTRRISSALINHNRVIVGIAVGGASVWAATQYLLPTAWASRRQLAGTHAVAVPVQSSPATTVVEALAQVTAATKADAAQRAADDAHFLDRGQRLLTEPGRWTGYEDGTASFDLAPGVQLHYEPTEFEYDLGHFTLLAGTDEPVDIRVIAQIRHHLAARAAGLPVAKPSKEQSDDSPSAI